MYYCTYKTAECIILLTEKAIDFVADYRRKQNDYKSIKEEITKLKEKKQAEQDVKSKNSIQQQEEIDLQSRSKGNVELFPPDCTYKPKWEHKPKGMR